MMAIDDVNDIAADDANFNATVHALEHAERQYARLPTKRAQT